MQNLDPISVIKASGGKEPFNEEKVIHSLVANGLSSDLAAQTVDYLKRYLKQNITTEDIFGRVTEFLQKNAPTEHFYNYGLKRAIMAMGPSGYPFEVLISDLLRLQGFKTEVGVVTQGKCVTHEIDVIAQKGTDKYFIECKYHNTPGYKTDIQVALYNNARFLDIQDIQNQHDDTLNYSSWLITNTKITSEAYDYCHCVNQKITTWDQPNGNGLQDLIISSGLHPITLLHELPKEKIQTLLSKDIVTCPRLKTAILNHELNDLLDQDETSLILKKMAEICK